MKKTITILIFGILISCSVAKDVKETSEKFTIKSIYQASYETRRKGEMTRVDAFKQEVNKAKFYDRNGFLIEYWSYHINGTIHEKTKLKNDRKGRLLEKRTYDDSGDLKLYLETEFDDNGNIIFMRAYNSENKLTSRRENKYDSRGNVVKSSITIFDHNKTKNEDNSENQFIKREKTDLESIRTYIMKGKYNSKSQLIKKTEFKPDGTFEYIKTFKYDKKGNEIKSEKKVFNGNYIKYISSYNERSDMLTQIWIGKDGTVEQRYNWEYSYDKYNNWITKKSFSNGELEYIWERKIEYY